MGKELKNSAYVFDAGAVVTPKTLATVPVLGDGQVQTVTDVRGMPLFVRKAGQLTPASGVMALDEVISMEVNSATGTSPPAGTIITSQAEYDALGYDLLYPQDALDILPPILQNRVMIKLKAGTHLAKPDSYSPGLSSMFAMSSKMLACPDGVLDFTSPSLVKDIIFYSDDSTIQDAEQSGTVASTYEITRTSGTWTIDAHKGMFCLFKTGVNAGTKTVIRSNTATKLITEGPALIAGVCTFEIITPAAILVGSSDGVTPCNYGLIFAGDITGGYGSLVGINFHNIQFGNTSFPCLNSVIAGGVAVTMMGCRMLQNDWSGWQVSLGQLYFGAGYWNVVTLPYPSGYPALSIWAGGYAVIQSSFVELVCPGLTFVDCAGGTFATWYSTLQALVAHGATPVLQFRRGGVYEPQGHHRIDGAGVAIGVSVEDGGDISSYMNLDIDNCLTAYNCRQGRLIISNGAGSNNTNGFVLTQGGSIQVYNPAGLAATNPISIDGVNHPYSDLANVGDYIIGQHGSKIGRS